MATYVLHKWGVTQDPWQAPEQSGKRLVGYRDSETEHRVVTSPIDKIQGNVITTQSGSIYVLDDPHPEYLQWLTDNGFTYDADNPIKDRRNEPEFRRS